MEREAPNNKSFAFWIETDLTVPASLLKRAEAQGTQNWEQLLACIDEEIMRLYGSKRDTAKSFLDSRFTPIRDIFERGMVSCGALVQVFGTVLRKLGVPARFVHGILPGQTGENRHAWLEVYDAASQKWLEFDSTQNHRHFAVPEGAKRIKVYREWGTELRNDYDAGAF
ncbi:MAG: hypothetical protein A2542_00890 [Parcubacteria group bacterium RIFOXYD2_FULL_52_8]|nr:MAG: hypothetical protein A2542_00890 [Parcubacteria group bacterium RIFOXYD2_FULL_52_8]